VNPIPILNQISLESLIAGSSDSPIAISGSGFNKQSQVMINGQPVSTSFIDAQDLTAKVPSALIAGIGELGVTIFNPTPGGGTSSAQQIRVVNPLPVLNQISPSSLIVGSADATITISGSGFNAQSQLLVNGQPLQANLLDSGHLRFTISAPLIAVTGQVGLGVFNPAPGGGMSALEQIAVINPVPALLQISPESVTAASTSVVISISGSGFNVQSSVVINSQPISTSFVDAQHVTAIVPASLVATAGQLPLIVSNPVPGGGHSSPQNLTVLNPSPTVTRISPQSVGAGSPDLTLTLTGSGFVASSQVSLNGQILASTLSDQSTLSVVIPSSDLLSGGTLLFNVTNGAPGGGSSVSPALTVMNPVPVVTSISPPAIFAGTGPTTVTISGSGFVPESSATCNGQVLTITYLSSTQLQVTVPLSTTTGIGSPSLVVNNPQPGGASSLAKAIAVLANGRVAPTANPQVASYFINIPDGTQARVEFGEHDYSLSTWTVPALSDGNQVRVLVAGMKPNSEYHMRAVLYLSDGSRVTDVDHTFNSGPLSQGSLPALSVTRSGLGKGAPGVQLFNDLDPSGKRVNLFAADRDGNIVWTYSHELVGLYQSAKLLEDGNLLVGLANGVREFNLAGETVQEISLDQISAALSTAGYSLPLQSVHHDVNKLSNGHYIILLNTWKSVILNGASSPTKLLGDVIVDLDSSLNLAWLWNSFDHLDVNRRPVDPVDWTHSNSIEYLPFDGSLLLSMRHQSWVLKIDYADGRGSGDILWKLGWQGDFSLPGAPIEWFYFQHYANVLTDDGNHMRIALFDNGDYRVLDLQGTTCGDASPGCYSRALILDIDEQAKTASVEFESNLNLYSNWGGSAQVLDNGNFLAGITATGVGGRAEEISTAVPGELVWQMDVLGQFAYRTLRIPSLYPGVQWP